MRTIAKLQNAELEVKEVKRIEKENVGRDDRDVSVRIAREKNVAIHESLDAN